MSNLRRCGLPAQSHEIDYFENKLIRKPTKRKASTAMNELQNTATER